MSLIDYRVNKATSVIIQVSLRCPDPARARLMHTHLEELLRQLDGLDIDYEDTVPLVEALVARVLGLDR